MLLHPTTPARPRGLTSVSPLFTASPSFLFHLAILPFVIVGDSAGMATVVARSATDDMHRRPQAPLGKTPVLAALDEGATACSITMGARDDDVADDIGDTDANEDSAAARRRARPACAVRASTEDGRMFGDGVATPTRHNSNTRMKKRVAPQSTGWVEACV